ncbi:hypothetical protein [Arthrobacter sp. Leaf141]|uniref:hypothetical protein n=1 Tax=Arthrobacter sp. Leaf141 TaxID=1736273 RepID=UPI0012FB5851|nr:hypothetical protein [Arthrobacter sp. Leaf141]
MVLMEPTDRQMELYLDEVINQAEGAVLHALQYNSAATVQDPPKNLAAICFAAVQGILTAAGQVHQLLWVNHGAERPREYNDLSDEEWQDLRQFAQARARTLRKWLKATDDSPVKSRAVRNSFEHFDARLDRVLALGNQNIVDRVLWEPGSIFIEGMPESSFLRRIDMETNQVAVLGDSVSYQQIVEELQRLAAAAQQKKDALFEAKWAAAASGTGT